MQIYEAAIQVNKKYSALKLLPDITSRGANLQPSMHPNHTVPLTVGSTSPVDGAELVRVVLSRKCEASLDEVFVCLCTAPLFRSMSPSWVPLCLIDDRVPMAEVQDPAPALRRGHPLAFFIKSRFLFCVVRALT